MLFIIKKYVPVLAISFLLLLNVLGCSKTTQVPVDKKAAIANTTTTVSATQEAGVTSEKALKVVEALNPGLSFKVQDQDETIDGTSYFKVVSTTGSELYVDKITGEVKAMNKYDKLENYEDFKRSMTGIQLNPDQALAAALDSFKREKVPIENNITLGDSVSKDDEMYYPIIRPVSKTISNGDTSGIDDLSFFVNAKNGSLSVEADGKFMLYDAYLNPPKENSTASATAATDSYTLKTQMEFSNSRVTTTRGDCMVIGTITNHSTKKVKVTIKTTFYGTSNSYPYSVDTKTIEPGASANYMGFVATTSGCQRVQESIDSISVVQ